MINDMSKRSLANVPISTSDDASASIKLPDGSEDIPPHIWQLLQNTGERAANRLYELLEPMRFAKLPASVQRGLLDLALTRAYGLPVRRSVNVSLGKGDLDAVAASLADLTDNLPERSPMGRTTGEVLDAVSEPHSASQDMKH